VIAPPTPRAPERAGVGIPNVTLKNVAIVNCGTGIRADGAWIVGTNVTMRGNQVGIDAENSHIDIANLDID
jgi:hypothetical protein